MVVVEQLSYSYPDSTLALDRIALHVQDGETVGVVGANGAGKSTLLLHLGGAILPQAGRIVLDKIEVTRANLDAVRNVAGLVFQNPDDQLFMPRVYDDVAFGLRNFGADEPSVASKLQSLLAEMDLWSIRDKPPFNLSQGQKRFAAIASVLAMDPKIILMDEPTSDLDARHRRQLIRFIGSRPQTVVIASHDLDFIWDTCSRTIVLDSGRIVADGPSREVLADKSSLEAHGLELPLRLQQCRIE